MLDGITKQMKSCEIYKFDQLPVWREVGKQISTGT